MFNDMTKYYINVTMEKEKIDDEIRIENMRTWRWLISFTLLGIFILISSIILGTFIYFGFLHASLEIRSMKEIMAKWFSSNLWVKLNGLQGDWKY